MTRLTGKQGDQQFAEQGFTLLEILVVVLVVAVLMGIVAPAWLKVVERRRVSLAVEKAYLGIRQAQQKALWTSSNWRFSIREGKDGYVEWAIHPEAMQPTGWQVIGAQSVKIDAEDTTLLTRGGVPYLGFDYKGNLKPGQPRTLTLTSEKDPEVKRCVIASTLIGTLRKGEGHSARNRNGRYCY